MKRNRIWNYRTVVSLAVAAAFSTVSAQEPATAPLRGPFWSGTVMQSKGQAAANKGLAITLGADKKHYVVYDLDTLRLATAWSGEFMDFGNTLIKIEWPPPPTVKGTVAFTSPVGPGWGGPAGQLEDPRKDHQGPLPKTWGHYQGLYVHGDRVVLQYSIGNTVILENPALEMLGDRAAFLRNIQPRTATRGLSIVLASGVAPDSSMVAKLGSTGEVAVKMADGRTLQVKVNGLGRGGELKTAAGGTLILETGALGADGTLQIVQSMGEDLKGLKAKPSEDLRPLLRGGPAHWGAPLLTEGKAGTEEGPYVVDTLTEPFPNPFRVSTFFGGFDFLPDGRLAACTFHGDVWIVSGANSPDLKLKWQRYATGLFQPLGLKVVRGEVYVAGRDQITRLKDLNGDGEADFYENFNNDTVVTPNYHEFVLDLHTDSRGNFYYAKGAPWEPSVTSPHQGTILKVSPDGKNMEVFATGLRAPNGMTVGPDDTVLVGDNQGHWMPSSKLNLVKPGSFMGMVPAAQKELTLRYPDGREIQLNPSDPAARQQHELKGWDPKMPIPTHYDEPICWVPMRWDNSSGGQVYVTSDRWGPWKGAPLFMSYGKCALYGVLMDSVEGTAQASMVPFNLKFPSGIMRARFNPGDGQLYLCGLKGWQNAATRDGGIYRVRYTGKPVRMAVRAHAARNGLEVKFSTELEAKAAVDTGNYAVELWNYRYSGGYGSDDYSVKNPNQKGHDKLEVKSARLGGDQRTVFLEVEGLQPANQYAVKYAVQANDGTEMKSEIFGTIHKLGPAIN